MCIPLVCYSFATAFTVNKFDGSSTLHLWGICHLPCLERCYLCVVNGAPTCSDTGDSMAYWHGLYVTSSHASRARWALPLLGVTHGSGVKQKGPTVRSSRIHGIT